MSAETRILWAPPGQPEWTAGGGGRGRAAPPLTALGRAQAFEASRALGALDAVWASDLERAAETAVIVSEALGVGPVVLDPDLRERDAGEWSGLTRDEIDERYPGYLQDGARPPGWEPDPALLERAVRVVRRIGRE